MWGFVAVITVAIATAITVGSLLTLPLDPRRRLADKLAMVWARILLAASPWWRVEISWSEAVDRNACYVVCANHQSFADGIALYMLRLPFKWISKRSVFWVPFMGWAMFFGGHVPLVRGDRASIGVCMQRCVQWLRRGVSIAMFPEGTRSADGQLQRFKDGAFRLSLQSGVAVLPVAIDGTRDVLEKGTWLFQPRAKMRVVVGAPITPEPGKVCEQPNAADVAALRDKARTVIANALADMRASAASCSSAS